MEIAYAGNAAPIEHGYGGIIYKLTDNCDLIGSRDGNCRAVIELDGLASAPEMRRYRGEVADSKGHSVERMQCGNRKRGGAVRRIEHVGMIPIGFRPPGDARSNDAAGQHLPNVSGSNERACVTYDW